MARRIMEDVRDMIQCDYIAGIRSADTVPQIMEFIQDDPWGNDANVAIAGFKRFMELAGPHPALRPALPYIRRILYANIETTMTILSSRMAAHRTNKEVQQRGVAVIRGLANQLLHFPFSTECMTIFRAIALDSDAFDSLVTAMMLHEQDQSIQENAMDALDSLLRRQSLLGLTRAETATRFVQAPEGNGQGIHVVFRALKNFPTNKYIVNWGLLIVCRLDEQVHVHQRLVEYTDAHDDWREILGNTDVALRSHHNQYTLLGTRIRDF